MYKSNRTHLKLVRGIGKILNMGNSSNVPKFQKGVIVFILSITICYIFWGGFSVQEPIQVIKEAPAQPPPEKLKNEPEKFEVAANGFWSGLGATRGHAHDVKLSAAIIAFLKQNKAFNVLELGCGLGKYAKEIRAEKIFISCYDGNPDTQVLSEGRCGVIDLSKPVDFSVHDWVLSLEVGEHIPNQFENIFIHNLDKHNKYGMILSWAIEGQGGTSHVNNHNNSYIRDVMSKLNYQSDLEAEKQLRAEASLGWFKNTIMVFRKNL